MSADITHLIQDPAWWFSTILVALVVNIFSALIYDNLRTLYASDTTRILLILCQVSYATLVFASGILIQSDNHFVKNYVQLWA